MTVGQLLKEVSSYEITEWMAYFDIKKVQADMAATQ